MPAPQQPEPKSTFLQNYRAAQWFTQFPALTAIVLLRRDVGFRLLHPLKLIAVAIALMAIALQVRSGDANTRPMDLFIFAWLFLAVASYQRFKRWRELRRNVRQHSYFVGTSPFDFKWLPGFCRRNRRCARFGDPMIVAAIGFAIFPVSRALGLYLAFSGFCLRAYEHMIFERELNRDLDLLDSMVRSEVQAETVEQFEPTPGAPAQSGGTIPTGAGPDTKAHQKRRRAQPADSFQNN
jgi:hypothetical protein